MAEKKLYILEKARLNNFTDAQVKEKISALWQKALKQVENQDESVMYGIYSDYESDYRGDYTLSIASEVPIGNDTITLPHGMYTTFITDSEHVASTWQQVWDMEQKGKLKRSYNIDYERYLAEDTVVIAVGKTN